ncbi:MAG TPA: hypothetical protein VI727_04060 [Candidatus Brocadiaceae bacterium]|nr:hypothetical protein [Candidatus Brocadiaceae bacterium]
MIEEIKTIFSVEKPRSITEYRIKPQDKTVHVRTVRRSECQ